jgi:hypothetical protein
LVVVVIAMSSMPDDALVPHTLVSLRLANGTLDPGVCMNLGSDGKDMRNALKDWYTSKQCSASAAKGGNSTQYKLICSTDQPVKTKHTAASGGVPIRCGFAVNVNKRADGRWFVTHAVTEHKNMCMAVAKPSVRNAASKLQYAILPLKNIGSLAVHSFVQADGAVSMSRRSCLRVKAAVHDGTRAAYEAAYLTLEPSVESVQDQNPHMVVRYAHAISV